jgi:hypothetical protein
MKSIFEIAYRYLIPAIRREIVKMLIRRGFMEVEIARLLNISHSLVSRYLSGKRGYKIDLSRYRDVMENIERVVDRIAGKDMDFYQIYEEIERIALYVLSNKYLCSIHKAIEPYIDISKCNICPNLFSQQKLLA